MRPVGSGAGGVKGIGLRITVGRGDCGSMGVEVVGGKNKWTRRSVVTESCSRASAGALLEVLAARRGLFATAAVKANNRRHVGAFGNCCGLADSMAAGLPCPRPKLCRILTKALWLDCRILK